MSACPRCGSGAVDSQEYCLECGFRLTGDPRLGRSGGSGRGWLLRASVALAVALAGAAVAVAATNGGGGSSDVITATGRFATLPTTSTLPSPDGSAAGTAEWPAGEDGWTIALASIPQTDGRRTAVARAAQARKKGLSPVGILDSSQYASLHPGYWIVFTGIFASEAEATSALQPARKASRTASVRRVVA